MPHRLYPLVLLVDDATDAVAIYRPFLERAGFDVIWATDGAEAIHIAQRYEPDVIVMDLSLPVLDGWEATRRLKADSQTASIPVVVLTAHAFGTAEERARAAGCDDYITKPCLPVDLVPRVKAAWLAALPRASGPRMTASLSSRRARKRN